MSVFTENINIAPLPKKNKWITTKPIRFYIYELGIWEYVDIPSWFDFDWCSIPICIFWAKVSPKTITPCCLHDYIFSHKLYWFNFSNFLFYKALRINWVWIIKSLRFLIWVTLFWWIAYYKIKDKIITNLKKIWNS